jgi:hypothetical protein
VKRVVSAIREELGSYASMKQLFNIKKVKKVIEAGDIALVHNQWEMISPKKMTG